MSVGRSEEVLGLLSGISYVSGLDYYKSINERYGERSPGKVLPRRNPRMVMYSLDCDPYADMLMSGRWDEVAEYLTEGAVRLQQAGATVLCICSNTGHVAVPLISKRLPSMGVLHIADCTARAVKAKGVTRVGLVGTEPTMKEAYLRERLGLHSLDVVVPGDDDQKEIFRLIRDELSIDRFTDGARQFFGQVFQRLAEEGCEGVILGCTEIELLGLDGYAPSPEFCMFQSGALHIEAAVDVCLGLTSATDYCP